MGYFTKNPSPIARFRGKPLSYLRLAAVARDAAVAVVVGVVTAAAAGVTDTADGVGGRDSGNTSGHSASWPPSNAGVCPESAELAAGPIQPEEGEQLNPEWFQNRWAGKEGTAVLPSTGSLAFFLLPCPLPPDMLPHLRVGYLV